MKYQDCQVLQQHIRSVSAIVLVGDRKLTAEESAALFADYRAAVGENQRPVVYFSPDGWQAEAVDQSAGAAEEPKKPKKPAAAAKNVAPAVKKKPAKRGGR